MYGFFYLNFKNGGASYGAMSPRKRDKTAGWVPHTAIFFQEVAGWRPFLLPNASKKEKVPKRKKFNLRLYFS